MNRYQKERKTKWGLFVRLPRTLKKPVEAQAARASMSVRDYVEQALRVALED